MNFNPLEILSNLGGLKKQAPELLAGFLDQLLDEQRPNLKPEDGEVQLFYIMTPIIGQDRKTTYIISIVALDENDRILRVLYKITLNDLLSTIFSSI